MNTLSAQQLKLSDVERLTAQPLNNPVGVERVSVEQQILSEQAELSADVYPDDPALVDELDLALMEFERGK